MMLKKILFVWMIAISAAESASNDPWVQKMGDAYITSQMLDYHRESIFSALRQIPEGSREWVERMARMYINDKVKRYNRESIFSALGQTPLASQPWVERMARIYITKETEGLERESIFSALRQISEASQAWVEQMARTYIYDYSWADEYQPGSTLLFTCLGTQVLPALAQTPEDSQPWVERMARTYIKERVDNSHHTAILSALGQTPLASQPWVEQMARTYISDQTNEATHASIITLSSAASVNSAHVPSGSQAWVEQLASFLIVPTSDNDFKNEVFQNMRIMFGLVIGNNNLGGNNLLEQARAEIMRRVNSAREERVLTIEQLNTIFTEVRDRVTENYRMNPGQARPRGRAFEVHYAASLLLPVEEREVPLYRAVETYIQKLSEGIPLTEAVRTLKNWTDQYADERQKSVYHRVIAKGYGDGRNPDYNEEITPLLRFVVPYMATLPESVRRAWLLPALQESATAYDEGDALSCGRGVQERLAVLGFDVDGVDVTLRSLSQFARSFIYIIDPTTYGADTWVKDSVSFLTSENKKVLLGQPYQEDSPEEEALQVFKNLFQPALRQAFTTNSGMTPVHVDALLKNREIQERFGISLSMHYQVEEHYRTLVSKVRESLTPEERRTLLTDAITRRLQRAVPPVDDPERAIG